MTRPDQLDPGAWEALALLRDEHVLRCWRAPFGFLVMTNLRCLQLWHRPELFVKSDWHAGPTFFFYNLDPPQLLLGRFVQLSETYDEGTGSARFLVRDAPTVCREIEDARTAGRREWEGRRLQAQLDLRRLQAPAAPAGTTVIVREVVKVRCSYCGNLVDIDRSRCPACGAPQR